MLRDLLDLIRFPSARPIRDAHFRRRYRDVPRTLARWISRRNFAGAAVLDFGCGEGVTALAVIRTLKARRVVGVDVMPDPERCLPLAREYLGLEALPPELELHRVAPGLLHDEAERFDIVYSWSVLEHVEPELFETTLGLLRGALRPGGVVLVQVAPLFFSAHGSHLAHQLREPWIHLRLAEDDLRARLAAVTSATECEALWSTYRGLNRITAGDLVSGLERHCFEVLRTYATRNRERPDTALLAKWPRDILTTEQIVVLARAV